MKEYLMKKFALTDTGAKAIIKASISCFLTNFGYFSFMIVAMYFGDNLLKGNKLSGMVFLGIIALVTLVVYYLVDLEYVRTFNATYEESKNIRLEIANKIKQLPLSYFFKHDLSDLSQTIMQDVLDIEHALSHSVSKAIAYLSFFGVMALLLLFYNFKLALAVLLPILIGFILVLVSKGLQKKWTGKYFWRLRKHSQIFQETIELQREIKTYNLENQKINENIQALDESEKLRLKAEVFQALPLLISTSIMKLSLGLTAIISIKLLKANSISIIVVIGYLLASVRLCDAFASIEESLAELFYIDSRVKRLNEINNYEIVRGTDVSLNKFDIELKNVTFGYDDSNKVVKNVSFVAKQGQVTAIVGPSGCGKSTILRLLSKLYDYNSGQILIDNYDLNDISTESLFKKISFVFQDVILFNASVLDNIRIGKESASDQEVIEAAKLANCQEFIDELPDGYNTIIGENGCNLSGGQRQRISIARAFLKNAPILLLDEISASLDVENEMKIQESLNTLMVGKTIIIVSHRLKSIEQVDQIIVMNDGKIDAMGKHEDLLKTSKLYQNLITKSTLTSDYSY